MAVQSNLKNMAAVLTLTCLLCSAVLGGAYALTKAPIDAAAREKTDKAIGQVLPAFDETSYEVATVDGKTYPYYKALRGGDLVGYAVESTTIGFGGNLSLMVGITPDGVVYNTSVLSHSETPGLGAKCASDAKFMAQWKGFDPSSKILTVKKDGGDVDAITASTITSRAYALAVQQAVDAVKALEDPVEPGVTETTEAEGRVEKSQTQEDPSHE
ncbi:MAG: RnfABCDGE type electron transport complex subunit G [Bacteroidales bacterium]|nr:RnfABCDGE type electron transport complex subunit G [Bacteroidales bacterium]